MENALKVIDKIIKILLAILFGIISFCVLVQILGRYLPFISAPWTDEVTRLFFLYTVMLSAPWAVIYHQYASIDVITSKFKGVAHNISNIIVDIFIMIITGIGVPQAVLYFKVGTVSKSTSLQINLGIFYIVPLIIFSLTFICCIIEIYMEIRELRTGEEVKLQ